MLANYDPTQYVNPCLPAFIRDVISMHRRVDSRFDKRSPVVVKKWFFRVFNKQDPIVELNASTLKVDRRKLTVSKMMDFVFFAALCLKPRAISIIFVIVKNYVHFSLKKAFNVVVGKKSSIKREKIEYKKRTPLFLKCLSDKNCTIKSVPLNNLSENKCSLTEYLLQEEIKKEFFRLRSMRH